VLRLVASVLVLVASVAFVGSAAAANCGLCLDRVALQTRDGHAWTAGQPVTLVVHVANNAAVPLPSNAQAVVMQTDGDRTKCLGVPLRLMASDATGGLYAGLFFPFRAARYDGKLVIAGDIQDITFDVNQVVAGAAPAGELPAAEPIDTSAKVPVLFSASQLPAIGLAAVALSTLAVLARRRRVHRAAVV